MTAKRQHAPPFPTSASVRFKLPPRLVSPSKTARYLHLPLTEFQRALPSLTARGFPRPCPVIGNFDLAAVNAWLDRQAGLGGDEPPVPDVEDVVMDRIRRYGKQHPRDGCSV